MLAASGCGSDGVPDRAPARAPAPPTSTGPIGAANVPLVTSIDVPGSRASLEAGQAEIQRVLEGHLGADGWIETRPAQETACPGRAGDHGGVDVGIGKFYAREMSHPEQLEPADWDLALNEVLRAVGPLGFRLKSSDPTSADEKTPAPPGRYVYLVNGHSDELTLSVHPRIGTGYGGFGVCHPWEL